MRDSTINDKNSSLNYVETQSKVEEIDVVTTVDTKVDDTDDKELLWKLDWHLLPILTILYLLSFLDRVNIGQAKLDGLPMSLKLSSTEYNTCVSVFFVTYVLFEIPSNLLLKRLRPSRWLPMIMVAWGIVMTLMGLVRSYADLLVCRLFLGAFEAGLFPGANFYLSSWYKRRELSWRVSFLLSATALAGAFGGVLAYGITKMAGVGGQEGWRWIFYLEGTVTVVVGVLAFFLLNDFPSNHPKFLTASECERVIARLQADAGTGASEHFSWKQVFAALLTWKIYVWTLCFIGLSIPFYSLSLFSPTIIQNLGFVTYQAQLLSAPPSVLAFITTMITAYFSDKYAHRSIFIIVWVTFGIIGYIILIAVPHVIIKYLAVILVAGSLSPCIATCIAFLSGNISPHTKRATALAFMISCGGMGGVVSGQIYRTQDAPHFILGHAANLGFCVLALITAIILFFGLRAENRRRDRLYGPVISSLKLGSSDSTSRMVNVQRLDMCSIGTDEGRRRWGHENMSEQEIRDLGDEHPTWRYIL